MEDDDIIYKLTPKGALYLALSREDKITCDVSEIIDNVYSNFCEILGQLISNESSYN